MASAHEWVEIRTDASNVCLKLMKKASFLNRNFHFVCCFLLKSLFGSTLLAFVHYRKDLALVYLITCLPCILATKC